MPDPREAEARRHLSSDILRIVDRSGIRYSEMEPGQAITVVAEDALTHKPGSFTLRVVSVRDSDKDVTFEYVDGDFNFHILGGTGRRQAKKLAQGVYMESGVTAAFIPNTDYRMVYMGGIGVGRDHSFEFVNGEDLTVVAHRISALQQGQVAPDFKAPDISEYLKKAKAAERRAWNDENAWKERAKKEAMEAIERACGQHPQASAMKDLISGYSPNGQLDMSDFLTWAQEDDVLDRAWEVLQEADKRHFSFEHPKIRGDLDFKASSREVYFQMLEDAGIAWPRPAPKDLVIILPDERRAQLRAKLAEYEGRLSKGPGYRVDSIHKIYVLKELLANGQVSPSELADRIAQDLGSDFDPESFHRAWVVMRDYCETGGEHLSGGTGLPQVQSK